MQNPRRILTEFVHEGDTVVDLGCGPGFFTLPLAQLVGATGLVVAVDIQEKMLAKMLARAEKAGLAARIRAHVAGAESLGVTGPADFVLAFWMVHEVPDKARFLAEAYDLLKQGGRLLLVEPRGHVSKGQFRRTVETALGAGFALVDEPRVTLSRAVLLSRS